MNIEFKSDNKKLLKHLSELQKALAPAAQSAALNATAGHIKRGAVKIAAQKTGVQAKILRSRIAVPRGKKATVRSLKTVVFGGLWVVPVTKLTPGPRKLKGGSVKYKTLPGQAINPAAFLAKNTNDKERVFVRKGAPRLPIQSITADIGPAVKSAIEGYGGGTESQDYYRKRVFTEMDRRIRSNLVRYGIRTR
jgi:hypothetical protein